MQVLAIDHIHFYIPDLSYWQNWFWERLGFAVVAQWHYPDRATLALSHGQLLIYLSAPYGESSGVRQFLAEHGAGIGEIGFVCDHPHPPLICHDIKHLFLDDRSLSICHTAPERFTAFDHVVLNVPENMLSATAQWYKDHLNLQEGDRFDIHTDYSGLTSLVLHNASRTVQIPINQPTDPNSQVQDFVTHYGGAGIQHVALRTHDIETTVTWLRQRGIEFLDTEPSILVEHQTSGRSLHQIFTKPIFTQPTFFWEIIERRQGAMGFGAGNFQALFEAIEHQQRQYVSH
jgi:4-hydroxyphenylpyruvate dioxygenase